MDISKELEKIIIDNNLDEYYPEYKKMLLAYELLNKLRISLKNKKVLFITTSRYDNRRFEKIFHSYVESNYVLVKRIETNKYGFANKYNYKVLDVNEIKKYDDVIILSYEGYSYIKQFLYANDIEAVSIYDYFLKNGLCLEHEYYYFCSDKSLEAFRHIGEDHGVIDPITYEIHHVFREYVFSKDVEFKAICKKKLLFLCLYTKDFVKASELMDESDDTEEELKKVWKEVKKLLSKIKERIKGRKDEAIILYWIDSLRYDDALDIDYINKIKGDTLWFDNMFTQVANTTPALKTLLCKTNPAEHKNYKVKKIDETNSVLLKNLKKHHYDFTEVGGWLVQLSTQYKCEKHIMPFSMVSERLWEMLRSLCIDDKKIMILLHEFMETHTPYLTHNSSDDSLCSESKMLEDGKKELSRQLEFYEEFIPERYNRIFMSDHGNWIFSERFHVMFALKGSGIRPGVVSDVSSLEYFSDIVNYIIEREEINLPKVTNEYAVLQGLDRYNGFTIGSIIKDKMPINVFQFGFRGLANKQHLYLLFNDGRQWLVERNEGGFVFDPSMLCDVIADKKAAIRYKEIIEKIPSTAFDDGEGRYTRFLYDIIKDEKTINNNKRKLDVIEHLFKELNPSSIGAIRTGGWHSRRVLFFALKYGKLSSVRYIIDNNPKCLCSKIGIPVINYEESKNKKIDYILWVAPSFTEGFSVEKKQYEDMGIKVIDIYEEMKKNNVVCRDEFDGLDVIYEELKLDYPFAEVGL